MTVSTLGARLREVIGIFSICRITLKTIVAGWAGDRVHGGGQAVLAGWTRVALVSHAGCTLMLTH